MVVGMILWFGSHGHRHPIKGRGPPIVYIDVDIGIAWPIQIGRLDGQQISECMDA